MIGIPGSIGSSRRCASQASSMAKRISFSIAVSPILTFIVPPPPTFFRGLAASVESVMLIGLLHARASNDEIQDRGNAPLIGGKSAGDRCIDVFRIGDLLAMAFACLRNLGKVRLHLEIGVDNPVAHSELLNVADRAKRALVENAPGGTNPRFGGHRQDVQHHLEGTVADEAEGGPG